MYYQIREKLESTDIDQCLSQQGIIPYVIVLSPSEWAKYKDAFDMGFDINPNPEHIYNSKAEVNYDSITGTFSIPDRANLMGDDFVFSFEMKKKGIVFIDRSGSAERFMENIAKTKKWREPSLEHFLYEFLERIIINDRERLERYEKELNSIEAEILQGIEDMSTARINQIRGNLLKLRTHYEQILDLGQVFEENENNYFKEENIRLFRLFNRRMERRMDHITSLRDYTVQLRDLYQTRLDVKQNRIMTILTIVTTIFMPLTLIVGWYGMNFRYMPELDNPYAYPMVMFGCLIIVLVSLLYFRKKKWL